MPGALSVQSSRLQEGVGEEDGAGCDPSASGTRGRRARTVNPRGGLIGSKDSSVPDWKSVV